MNWHRWLATLFVLLALAACTQGGQAPHAPSSPQNIHDSGGGGVKRAGAIGPALNPKSLRIGERARGVSEKA